MGPRMHAVEINGFFRIFMGKGIRNAGSQHHCYIIHIFQNMMECGDFFFWDSKFSVAHFMHMSIAIGTFYAYEQAPRKKMGSHRTFGQICLISINFPSDICLFFIWHSKFLSDMSYMSYVFRGDCLWVLLYISIGFFNTIYRIVWTLRYTPLKANGFLG